MSYTKEYKIKFPVVLTAEDYHQFDDMANVMSDTLNESIIYTEIGFDYRYFAAFHPRSITLDTEDLDSLRMKYNLEPD